MLYFILQTNLENVFMYRCLLVEELFFLTYQLSDCHGISRIVFLTVEWSEPESDLFARAANISLLIYWRTPKQLDINAVEQHQQNRGHWLFLNAIFQQRPVLHVVVIALILCGSEYFQRRSGIKSIAITLQWSVSLTLTHYFMHDEPVTEKSYSNFH